MGDIGQRLQQEQWEEVGMRKLRDEGVRMAERLGEEMGSGSMERRKSETRTREKCERTEREVRGMESLESD